MHLTETFTTLISKFQSSSDKVQPLSSSRYRCCCPLDQGKLLVELHDDRITMQCEHDCELGKICRALDVEPRELVETKIEIWQSAQNQERPEHQRLAEQYLQKQQLPPFDPHCLPDALCEYVKDISEVTDSSPIVPTISIISTLSAYAMHRISIPDYFQHLYCNLWSIVIAQSGDYKSTGLRYGTRLLKVRDDYYDEAIAMAEAISDGEDPAQLRKKKRKLPDTLTWQALIDSLDEQGGGLFIQSEMQSFFSMVNTKFNDGMKSRLTSIYDVVDDFEERTRGRGCKPIRRPYVSIMGVSTKEFLKPHITQDDMLSGFLARFLFFLPPADDGEKVPNALPVKAAKVYQEHWPSYIFLGQLCDQLLNSPERFGSCDRLSHDAKTFYNECFHDRILGHCKQSDPAIKPYLDIWAKRWAPTLLKLGMIVQQVIDCRQVEPSKEALQSAWQILSYAMQSTTLLLQEEFNVSPLQDKLGKVIKYIAKRGGLVDYRALINSKILDGGPAEYDYALETLQMGGKIRINGKPKSKSKVELVDER
jgi:hypothetical protein